VVNSREPESERTAYFTNPSFPVAFNLRVEGIGEVQ
jgi:hypothetical protein